MTLTDIRLQNFRSYKDMSFELDGGVNIVVGPNGAGKTNLLEAIMLGCGQRTYRAKEALVAHGHDWGRVDLHTDENQLRTVKIFHEGGQSRIQNEIDGKTYAKLPYSQQQPVVLFEPNHLLLLQGEPQLRRNYLDDLLEQLSAYFSKTRADYRRVVSQRNRLLKQGSKDRALVFAWNVRLIELATKIVFARKELLKEITQSLSHTYSAISGKKTNIEIKYSSTVDSGDYSATLLKRLENDMEKDLARGFTGHGPHRDDMVFYMDGQEMSAKASRGEVRTLLLSLKIIELSLVEKTAKKPTLLLDDVFSELDGARRKHLIKYLKNYQTIITTTDADMVLRSLSQNCQTIPLG